VKKPESSKADGQTNQAKSAQLFACSYIIAIMYTLQPASMKKHFYKRNISNSAAILKTINTFYSCLTS